MVSSHLLLSRTAQPVPPSLQDAAACSVLPEGGPPVSGKSKARSFSCLCFGLKKPHNVCFL